MKKYIEKKKQPLSEFVNKLTNSRIVLLRKVLRDEFSAEIETSVSHRKYKRKRTQCLPDEMRDTLRSRWAGKDCPVCRKYMNHDTSKECYVQVEHVNERALGGKNEHSNLVPCCNNCNRTLGDVFNQYIIQAREKRGISYNQWIDLIGKWVLFKTLLYSNRNLAFVLFKEFHEKFNQYSDWQIEDNFNWLIDHTIISERVEKVVRKVNEIIDRNERIVNARNKFERDNGPPPMGKMKCSDWAAKWVPIYTVALGVTS